MDSITLITIGFILILTEIFITSFVIIWFGMSFVTIGIINYIVPINITIQLILLAIITAIYFIILKKPLIKYFDKNTEKVEDNFIKNNGIGLIKNNMLYYQGIFFTINNLTKNEITLLDGKNVKVLKVDKNSASIEPYID